jgi:ketol-acid reductoisomerase
MAGNPARLFSEIEEAAERGTIIEMLTSDASQRLIWPDSRNTSKKGDALYFSHGFSIVYKDQTV